MNTATRSVDTPCGNIVISAVDAGICAVKFAHSLPSNNRAGTGTGTGYDPRFRHLEQCTEQLQAYFSGALQSFALELAPEGTDFQRTVWQALSKIPYGETCSYGELALAIGRPTASRAVGAANGQNPIAIVVPCHRVIGSNGTLTGYAGGLDIKRKLLELESGQLSL